MHGEDFFVNDSSDWQAVKAVGERFPQFDVVSPFAFVIETVDTVDGRALMVPAEDEKVFRVLDFVRQQETDSLERLFTSINVVSKKEIVSFRRETAVLKQTQEIVVLSVDITAYLIVVRGMN